MNKIDNKYLKDLLHNIYIDTLYYPYGQIHTSCQELIDIISELYDERRLSEVFPSEIVKSIEEIVDEKQDFFDDTDYFIDWIYMNNLNGFIATLSIPAFRNIKLNKKGKIVSAKVSFASCHLDYVYFNTQEELLSKLYILLKKWKDNDIELERKRIKLHAEK